MSASSSQNHTVTQPNKHDIPMFIRMPIKIEFHSPTGVVKKPQQRGGSFDGDTGEPSGSGSGSRE